MAISVLPGRVATTVFVPEFLPDLGSVVSNKVDLVVLTELYPHHFVVRSFSPVLILSGLTESENKVKGLGTGADDYLTKPFEKNELLARIQAIVRRSQGHSQSIISTGRLSINLDAQSVEIDGQAIHLTGKEYGILELLSLRKGTTLTKEMFLNHLYGGMDEPELKIIDVFICKLRKKLSTATGGVTYIETVWGRGYVLRDPQGVDESSRATA